MGDQSKEWSFESSHKFYFLGERYAYSIIERYLEKLPQLSKCVDRRSLYVNQEELEKIVNESFTEVKSFIDDASNRQFLESHIPVVLYELNDLIIKSQKELERRLLLYSQKLGLFEEACKLLEEIIEKNRISKEDPEKAVLDALNIIKKEGRNIKLQYEDVKKLAYILKSQSAQTEK